MSIRVLNILKQPKMVETLFMLSKLSSPDLQNYLQSHQSPNNEDVELVESERFKNLVNNLLLLQSEEVNKHLLLLSNKKNLIPNLNNNINGDITEFLKVFNNLISPQTINEIQTLQNIPISSNGDIEIESANCFFSLRTYMNMISSGVWKPTSAEKKWKILTSYLSLDITPNNQIYIILNRSMFGKRWKKIFSNDVGRDNFFKEISEEKKIEPKYLWIKIVDSTHLNLLRFYNPNTQKVEETTKKKLILISLPFLNDLSNMRYTPSKPGNTPFFSSVLFQIYKVHLYKKFSFPIARYISEEDKIEWIKKNNNIAKHLNTDIHLYYTDRSVTLKRFNIILSDCVDGDFSNFVQYFKKYNPNFRKVWNTTHPYNETYPVKLKQVYFHLVYNQKREQYFFFRNLFKNEIKIEKFLPVITFLYSIYLSYLSKQNK